MLAKIEKNANGYVVTYERLFDHRLIDVWEMFIDNNKLSLWFDELRVMELGQDGYLNFDMGNGTFEKMAITDYQEFKVLAFTWDEDLVRFEFTEQGTSCKLVLIEELTQLTGHTPKDLAGWHVCLDVIATILDNKEVKNRMDNWKYWFEKYTEALNSFK